MYQAVILAVGTPPGSMCCLKSAQNTPPEPGSGSRQSGHAPADDHDCLIRHSAHLPFALLRSIFFYGTGECIINFDSEGVGDAKGQFQRG